MNFIKPVPFAFIITVGSTKITKVGRAMASFPVSPRFGKMLCLAHQHNLLAYVVAIVAALSVQEVFVDLHQPISSQNEVGKVFINLILFHGVLIFYENVNLLIIYN